MGMNVLIIGTFRCPLNSWQNCEIGAARVHVICCEWLMFHSSKRYNAVSEAVSRNEYQNAGTRLSLNIKESLSPFEPTEHGSVVSLSDFLPHEISFVRTIESLCELPIAFTEFQSIRRWF